MKPATKVTEKSKQVVEASPLDKWEWVEPSVWTENMLTALGNGVKGGKWFSLIDKVYAMPTLQKAWNKVRENKGAAGVDKISIEQFSVNTKHHLDRLQQELEKGYYAPQAVKRVFIPKGKGKKRPLGIPVVKDRIVQTALKMVLEPIFENEFISNSYGFRPGKGCKDALREVDVLVKTGNTIVVDADITSYFDNIDHHRLLELIKQNVSDSRVIRLIKLFLKQPIYEGIKKWNPLKGSPQGAVISPLLANIYLHPLDKRMKDKGYKMIRYADDFVVLCNNRKKAEEALATVKRWTSEQGLSLHPDKTRIGNCAISGEGFEFLGYHFECGKRRVRKTSMKAFKSKVRTRTKRSCGKSMKQVIDNLNPLLRGWFNYFKHADSWTFRVLDGQIRRRLRAIRRKQEKRPGTGRTHEDHKRWPNSYFANLGLFSLYEARNLACQS